jgi:hypothetical protein
VHPLAHLDGVIVQAAAEPEHVALFRLAQGHLRGPALFSVMSMRHPNEAAGSTSLFAQPVVVEAVPLEAAVTAASRDELEQRLDEALAALLPDSRRSERRKASSSEVADHLCLFSRWYYRPQAKRAGEVVFAGEDGQIPRKSVLRAISRVFQKVSLEQSMDTAEPASVRLPSLKSDYSGR